MASVNPFNLSDSEEEPDRRPNETVDTERSPSDGAPGPPTANPFSPLAETEPQTLLLSSNRTSPSGEGISVSVAATSAMAGSTETRVSVDVIAGQLLRDQYILTALEFHTELLEAGRELPRLRDYFSNPGNFERQSGTPPAKDQVVGPGGPLSKSRHPHQISTWLLMSQIAIMLTVYVVSEGKNIGCKHEGSIDRDVSVCCCCCCTCARSRGPTGNKRHLLSDSLARRLHVNRLATVAG